MNRISELSTTSGSDAHGRLSGGAVFATALHRVAAALSVSTVTVAVHNFLNFIDVTFTVFLY